MFSSATKITQNVHFIKKSIGAHSTNQMKWDPHMRSRRMQQQQQQSAIYIFIFRVFIALLHFINCDTNILISWKRPTTNAKCCSYDMCNVYAANLRAKLYNWMLNGCWIIIVFTIVHFNLEVVSFIFILSVSLQSLPIAKYMNLFFVFFFHVSFASSWYDSVWSAEAWMNYEWMVRKQIVAKSRSTDSYCDYYYYFIFYFHFIRNIRYWFCPKCTKVCHWNVVYMFW